MRLFVQTALRNITAQRIVITIGIMFLLAGVVLVLNHFEYPYSQLSSKAGRRETVRIAFAPMISSTLPILAHDDGYWKKLGLDVELMTPQTGADAITLLESNKVDFAVAYDTPVVNAILRGTPVKILTELHTARTNTVIVYRRDRGIKTPADLAGKKLGIMGGTNGEFFLDLFLKTNALSHNDLTIERTSDPFASDLQTGLFDANIMWEPQVSMLVLKNPELFGIFALPFYSEVSMIMTTEAYMDTKPDIAERVVKGIAQALNRFNVSPKESHEVVQRFLESRGLPLAPQAWDKIQVRMGLGHFLQTSLSEQIRQRLGATATASKIPLDSMHPNIAAYFAPAPLRSIMPKWVALP